MKKYLALAFIGLTFGALTGYFGEHISHRVAALHNQGTGDPWYWWLALPSLPGDAFVFNFYNLSDSYLDDEWDYRFSISVFNGLQWMIAFVIFPFAFSLFRTRKRTDPRQARDDGFQ